MCGDEVRLHRRGSLPILALAASQTAPGLKEPERVLLRGLPVYAPTVEVIFSIQLKQWLIHCHNRRRFRESPKVRFLSKGKPEAASERHCDSSAKQP